MRWPPGGIIGGAKNSLFEICRCLRRIMALRFGDLAYGLGIWVFIRHAAAAPFGAGGGLPPPRGNTAARPSLFYCPWGLKCFVFVDLCDICNIDLREFGLCTLPSSEPRTSARSETWSGTALPKSLPALILLKCYVFQHFYRSTSFRYKVFH